MEHPSHRLDPRMLRVWYASSLALMAGTVAAGAVATLIVRHFNGPLCIPLAVCGVLLVIELADMAISPRVEYATWRFAVTPTDVDLYHSNILIFMLQYIESGPWFRTFTFHLKFFPDVTHTAFSFLLRKAGCRGFSSLCEG